MKRILIISLLSLTGCAITPNLPNLVPPKPPHTTYLQEEVHSSVPVLLVDSQGTKYASAKTEQHIITKYNYDEAPKGFLSRIGSFLGGLGFWIIVGILIAFVIAPGGTMIWLWNQKKRFQSAFEETVSAIKTSNAVDAHPALSTALDSTQSDTTKQMVGIVKATL